jgi:phosphohistidine phosphatase
VHRLHLLRHAKASRDEGHDDRARPLTRLGRDTARRVGESVPAALGPLDLVLCSSSARTRETAELTLAAFAPPPQTLYEDLLYLAPDSVLLRRLRQLDETVGSLLVIGHNPGLHELAEALADPKSPGYRRLAQGKFPTLARVSLDIATPWHDLGPGRNRVAAYVTPKDLGDQD